jgi:hypothetical protein
MSIEVTYINPDYINEMFNLIKILYPDIDIKSPTENNTKNYHRRLIQKFIRDKDLVLQSIHILLKVDCPIFVLSDLLHYLKKFKFSNLNYNLDNISFEIPTAFEDSDRSYFTSLFKKVISTKDNLSKSISEKDIISILPMASNVTFNLYVDFLEIYDIITTIQKSNVHPKTNKFVNDIFDFMNEEYPLFFSKQNLEIYLANKER